MRRAWAAVTSLKTTAILIAALAALLLVNVLVPQARIDPDAYAAALRRGGVAPFLLERLRLGHVSTSPVFVGTLVAFLVNLAGVLVDRVGVTARRLRLAVPTGPQLAALLGDATATAVPGSPAEVAARATQVLETMGYRVLAVGHGALWAVKHRWALLGFPVFHAAFFVMALGDATLYWTREVVSIGACEGQTVASAEGAVGRRAPAGPSDPVSITVDRVDVKLDRGKPTDLAVDLRLLPGAAVRTARVNHPAVWGDLSALVDRVGVAPVLWVMDEGGYTRDRVAVMVQSRGDLPTRVPLDAGAIEAVVEPIPVGPAFPERSALSHARIWLRLRQGGGATSSRGASRRASRSTWGPSPCGSRRSATGRCCGWSTSGEGGSS
ncbi:MAG: cytochrome c biogenesis protein ResB [Anaeromyxobacteraceae bacterium]